MTNDRICGFPIVRVNNLVPPGTIYVLAGPDLEGLATILDLEDAAEKARAERHVERLVKERRILEMYIPEPG